jgi:hypothetical protein
VVCQTVRQKVPWVWSICGASTHRVGMNTWPQTHKANIESVMVTWSVHVTNILTEVVAPHTSAAGVSDSETEGDEHVGQVHSELV